MKVTMNSTSKRGAEEMLQEYSEQLVNFLANKYGFNADEAKELLGSVVVEKPKKPRKEKTEEEKKAIQEKRKKTLAMKKAKKEAEKVKNLKEWDNDYNVDDDYNLYDKEGTKVGKVVDVDNAVLEFFD